MVSEGLARASQYLTWASLGLAQVSGGRMDGWTKGKKFTSSPFVMLVAKVNTPDGGLVKLEYQV